MRQAELDQKARLINASLDAYCKQLPGCGKPMDDPRTILYQHNSVVHVNQKTVECPDGKEFKLLSCTGHSAQWQNDEKWKHIILLNSRKCQCFTNYGGNCIA